MWVRKVVSFSGSCAARSSVVLVSRRINVPFRLRRVMAHFPSGTQDLMDVSIWVSADASAPTAGFPTGVNILSQFGQADYLEGDGRTFDLAHWVDVRETGMYLKVHADNSDFYAHRVDVQVEVEVEVVDVE